MNRGLVSSLLIDEARRYVADKFGAFHQKRLDNLKKLKLSNILKGKNFYLFCAKNILTAPDFIKIILDAHLSSQEKILFGDLLEGLAIYINEKLYGGRKSTAEGIDLEFDKAGVRFIAAIKSGLNWGNSEQIARMTDNFRKAARIHGTSPSSLQVILGACHH